MCINMVEKIEKCSERVFISIAIDKIMKQSKVSEKVAIEIYNKILDNIEFDNVECINPLGYYSTRYAIMNRIIRGDY